MITEEEANQLMRKCPYFEDCSVNVCFLEELSKIHTGKRIFASDPDRICHFKKNHTNSYIRKWVTKAKTLIVAETSDSLKGVRLDEKKE